MAYNVYQNCSDDLPWSQIVEQDSNDGPPENSGSTDPEFALPYRSTDPGAVKDHIGFISTSEEWSDQRLMNKLAAIRRFPSWSSPLPDPSTTEVAFKFKVDGSRYLEFLSLFLTGDRRVDIGFSSRHAIVCFLTRQLEESHFRYFRQNVPQEFDILQMPSADVFELHVWQAFLRGGWNGSLLSDYVVDEDGKRCYFVEDLDYIRQLAVHRTSTFRYSLSTSTIRSAAACALHLGDYTLLEQIELVIRVLYADSNDSSVLVVTEEEKEAVNNLLWPANRQITSVVQLLDAVQNIAERSSYDFCQRSLPEEVSAYRPTTHEHFELNMWHRILSRQAWSRTAPGPNTAFYEELTSKLRSCPITDLRNAVAHRENAFQSASGYTWEEKVVFLLDIGFQYVQILGDNRAAAAVEDLKLNIFPRLVQQHEEWMGPDWCATTDWAGRIEQLKDRSGYWAEKQVVYFEKKVDIRPIAKWYMAAFERIYNVQEALGNIKIYQPPPEQSENQTAVDSSSQESEIPGPEQGSLEQASSQHWSPWEGDNDQEPPDWGVRSCGILANQEGKEEQLESPDSYTSAPEDQALDLEEDDMDDVRSMMGTPSGHEDRDDPDVDNLQGFEYTEDFWGTTNTIAVNANETRAAGGLLNGNNGQGAVPWVPHPGPRTEYGW
ncbi:MAG: hypothetical protein LQ352_002870 [Teloschistes flavicans]|nr:MAG: hypothetical protein LQ352_002870 [Teloschistes flavicans]